MWPIWPWASAVPAIPPTARERSRVAIAIFFIAVSFLVTPLPAGAVFEGQSRGGGVAQSSRRRKIFVKDVKLSR
jgi:hypothetical protein